MSLAGRQTGPSSTWGRGVRPAGADPVVVAVAGVAQMPGFGGRRAEPGLDNPT
jgi:hypothetical protein